MLKKLFQIFSQNKLATLLILVGTIVWSLTMVKSGLPYPYGLGFWGPNGHDGVWHIALAESLARGSFQMPTFAGESLQNYHIGFDLLLAVINRLTRIPISVLYFQIFPPILALLIGALAYRFVVSWTKSKKAAFWSVFFVYFGGGFGWLVTLLRSGEIGGESMFWSQQAISTLINPPFATSLVFLLLGLNFLLKKTKTTLDYLLCTFFFGLLIQIKAYAGVLALGALLVAGVWRFIREKKLELFFLFLSSLVFSLAIYLPFNRGSQNLLVFQPFWFLETMMGYADRLGWPRFYSAMTNYRMGRVWLKGTFAYVVAFLIFWYGNIGTRLVKEVLVFKWIKNFRNLTWVEVFLASIIVAGGLIPMFFLQKGTPWNTIQFFYYSLFFSGLLAGVALPELLEKVKNSIVLHKQSLLLRSSAILLSVVLFTLPTTIGTLRHYLPSRPPAMLPAGEQEALKFLSKQPNGVVLTYPFDINKAKEAESSPPRPLYLYESTAYVSAFAKKPVYLEDEINLDITGYNWQERRKKVEEFYTNSSSEFLTKNSISYLYLVRDQALRLDSASLGIEKVFENSSATVFKVEQ